MVNGQSLLHEVIDLERLVDDRDAQLAENESKEAQRRTKDLTELQERIIELETADKYDDSKY